MRYKYYQIECADIEDSPEFLHLAIASVTVSSNFPTDKPRLSYSEVGQFWANSANSNVYDFLKLTDNLYRRVDKGTNTDVIHGNQGAYVQILPETHPGYNFDIYYLFCCTGYQHPLDDFYDDQDLIDIVTNTFPELVAANKD